MAKASVDSFLQWVRLSELVSQDQLEEAVERLKESHGGSLPQDAAQVAEFLVQSGLLTPWQSSKLLAGKYKGFFLGRYKLLELLGSGGMGAVYLAEHTLMGQKRAIKVLPRARVGEASYYERFLREARAAAALNHPNIVKAYDVDQDRDVHFLVMEYVPGKNLQEMVQEQGPLEIEQAVDYIAQAARGLAHAHRNGIVHRDVKPANLLVSQDGTVKILDLGLALAMDPRQSSLTLQHDESVLGTADYLSPEQALDSHAVDPRADIYSLGCTLYFALTGRPPFAEGTLAQRIAAHQSKMPPDIRTLRPDCPPDLVGICMKMIQKEPHQRYGSAEEVAQRLEAFLEEYRSDSARAKATARRGPMPAGESRTSGSAAPPRAKWAFKPTASSRPGCRGRR